MFFGPTNTACVTDVIQFMNRVFFFYFIETKRGANIIKWHSLFFLFRWLRGRRFCFNNGVNTYEERVLSLERVEHFISYILGIFF